MSKWPFFMTEDWVDRIAELVQTLPNPLLQSLIELLSMPVSPKALLARQRLLSEVSFEHQAMIKVLFEALKDSEINPSALALALRVGVRLSDQISQAQNVELVWTGPRSGVATRQTGQVVQEVIRAAQKLLWIVSFTVRDIDELKTPLLEALSTGVSVRLIMEDKQERDGSSMKAKTMASLKDISLAGHANLTCYIWPPFMRQQKTNRADQVYLTDSLHAKCLLADTHKLFITSANLTRTALNQNMELGVLLTGGSHPHTIQMHFQQLIEKGILLALPKEIEDEKS
jgi:phosphatidylserine/phosphatidylglycerophosphate/cardiolipin synthase-like enzyme